MCKTLIVVSVILVIVLADIKFEQVPFGSETRSYNAGDEISRPNTVSTYAMPPDNGVGNYEDRMWRHRVQGDSLLTRLVLINDISPGNDQFPWAATFPGKNITHVRFLNFGRERAWVEEIRCNWRSISWRHNSFSRW